VNPTDTHEPRPLPVALQDELRVVRPAGIDVVIGALVGGAAVDLALRSGVVGVGGALAVLVAAVALVASRRITNPHAIALAAAAPVFGVWLAIRTSAWLVPFDILAAGGLLCLAASFGRGGSVLGLTVPGLAVRAASALGHGIAAPAFVIQARGQDNAQGRRTVAVVRGALFAFPLVVVMGALLASADPVFASFFHIDVGVRSLVLHVVWIGFGGWAMAGLLRVASADVRALPEGPLVPVGSIEALIVLAAVDVIFGAFAIAQLVASSNAGHHVLATRGLTYADYARSGFFQLVAVAAITFVVLAAVRGARRTPSVAVTVAAVAAIALTLVIVAVALHRLDLYADVYGLTTLRLLVTVVAWWIGFVFVLLAVAWLGVGRHRPWLIAAVIGSALVVLFALDVVNPDAVVARHDIHQGAHGGRFDAVYVASLSPDAIPTIVHDAAALASGERSALDAALRHRQCPRASTTTGWAAANLGNRRAAHAFPCPEEGP